MGYLFRGLSNKLNEQDAERVEQPVEQATEQREALQLAEHEQVELKGE
ncbi:hypothetical protein ACE1YR_19465 [Pseudomonas sp. K1(2024)]|uniref:Uncharacterized protein n=1 Tax=Pseudomonas boreofloridensis TaxID=3064348 RepID=A0ABV4ZD72_9PSED|nr:MULTISPECIES: hypothetical protein [Pseudomonas]MDO7902372.1 hypothetical protein [Pseudomonas sp. K13]MDV9030885.1 hypothetical protein [Pseudomonas sp. RAC1]